jgi:uncharacterized protein
MAYLLDANVLIALSIAEHEHHPRVSAWLSAVDRVALCPIVEGSLVRFLIRVGESARTATEIVSLIRADPRCDFWPDSVSYADVDLSRVRGHRQVTDAYLVALASSHDGCQLATLDEALAQEWHEHVLLVPAG